MDAYSYQDSQNPIAHPPFPQLPDSNYRFQKNRNMEAFFYQDSQNPMARLPLPSLEDIVASGIWRQLHITYTRDELTYASVNHPGIVYRVPLKTIGEREKAPLLHTTIVSRLEMLIRIGCFEKVLWQFWSDPAIDITHSATFLLSVQAQSFEIKKIDLHIGTDIDQQYIATIFENVFDTFFMKNYGLLFEGTQFCPGGLYSKITSIVEERRKQLSVNYYI
ncbi:hypothetical protein TRVA0_001S07074 [Trichomonascus vanleenenianus]|uniref:uncharacterized protein n=1 Tax=Trichomonascus vanleenenianus TaxID=2268995 RepID=UPI003EC9DF9A